jgi:hypothetical protein
MIEEDKKRPALFVFARSGKKRYNHGEGALGSSPGEDCFSVY